MADTVPKYQRLPGRGATLTGVTRLWWAPDHLLYVASVGYHETYRRFYFSDLQAVMIRRTEVGRIWTAIWAGFAILWTLIALQLSGIAAAIFWALAAVCLVVMLGNLALGPSCVCYAKTAVQLEKLPMLHRLRNARKVLNRIRPLIAAAQGELTPEVARMKGQNQSLAGRGLGVAGHGDIPDAPPIIPAD